MKVVTDLSVTSRPFRPPAGSQAALGVTFDALGLHFDPARTDTLFQDAEGTVPVTGDGQPVGRILDLSGHGLDAQQSISSARPLWRTDGQVCWLEFDGADDFLQVPLVPFAVTSTISCALAASKEAGKYNGPLLELTGSLATAGAFSVIGNSGSLANWGLHATMSSVTTFRVPTPDYAATSVLQARWDMTTSQTQLNQQLSARLDGVDQPVAGSGTDAGSFATAPLFIGRRNGTSLPWAGRLYGVAIIGRALSGAELQSAETFLASLSGVSLP
tara:strand:- start:8802 stop:9620 length:819 start_codon:yes stop_codon:yes gene_type:complete